MAGEAPRASLLGGRFEGRRGPSGLAWASLPGRAASRELGACGGRSPRDAARGKRRSSLVTTARWRLLLRTLGSSVAQRTQRLRVVD